MAQERVIDKIVIEMFRLAVIGQILVYHCTFSFPPCSLAGLFGQIHEFCLQSCEQPVKYFKKKTDMYIQIYIYKNFPDAT